LCVSLKDSQQKKKRQRKVLFSVLKDNKDS
jgi:hypothetical protein